MLGQLLQLKKNKIESPFPKSGCLSAATINNYLDGRLSDEENESVIKHINECEFCADAVEGYKNMKLKDSLIKTVGQLNRQIDKKSGTRDYRLLFINRKVLAYSSLAASILVLAGLFLLLNNNRVRQDNIVSQKLVLKKDKQLKPGEQEKNKKPGSLLSYDSLFEDKQKIRTALPEEQAMPVARVPAAESHTKDEMADIAESEAMTDIIESEVLTKVTESEAIM